MGDLGVLSRPDDFLEDAAVVFFFWISQFLPGRAPVMPCHRYIFAISHDFSVHLDWFEQAVTSWQDLMKLRAQGVPKELDEL